MLLLRLFMVGSPALAAMVVTALSGYPFQLQVWPLVWAWATANMSAGILAAVLLKESARKPLAAVYGLLPFTFVLVLGADFAAFTTIMLCMMTFLLMRPTWSGTNLIRRKLGVLSRDDRSR